jgi:hypothetical protein
MAWHHFVAYLVAALLLGRSLVQNGDGIRDLPGSGMRGDPEPRETEFAAKGRAV